MHPASYSNTHHVTDFLNYVAVKNTQKLNILLSFPYYEDH